jgi:hypothetical protein
MKNARNFVGIPPKSLFGLNRAMTYSHLFKKRGERREMSSLVVGFNLNPKK